MYIKEKISVKILSNKIYLDAAAVFFSVSIYVQDRKARHQIWIPAISVLMSTRLHHTSHPKSQSVVFPLDTEKAALFDVLHGGIPHWIFHHQHAFCLPEMRNIQLGNTVKQYLTA